MKTILLRMPLLFTLTAAAFFSTGGHALGAETERLNLFFTNDNSGYLEPCG